MTIQNSVSNKVLFTEKLYAEMIHEADRCLGLSYKERENLEKNSVPRFIAEIPFMAEQENPEEKGIFNLISYVTGSRNPGFFAQRKAQTIRERIDTYLHGSDGNREIMELCRDIIEEVSLYDHKSDLEEDKKTGHPNPILRGEIDFIKEKRRLKAKRLNYSPSIRNMVEGKFEGEVLSKYWWWQ